MPQEPNPNLQNPELQPPPASMPGGQLIQPTTSPVNAIGTPPTSDAPSIDNPPISTMPETATMPSPSAITAAPTPTPSPSNSPSGDPIAAPNPQAFNPSASFSSGVGPSMPIVSASSMYEQSEAQKPKWYKPSKKLALAFGVVFILVGGSAAAYFGYVVPNKPQNLWNSALTNTGKGYDQLSKYATSKKNAKGITAKGSFKVGNDIADGTFSGQSDGQNGKFSGTVSAVGLKLDYDVRAIASGGNTPDIYFKIDGLQGLGSLAGNYISDPTTTAQISNALNGLNGQWYFVDHTLFNEFAGGSNSEFQLSSADVNEVLKAVGDASHQYIFTSDPVKATFVVKQNVGHEKQDGRNVYHYKVGVNKSNLTAYSQTLCGDLAKTKIFKLFNQGGTGDQDLTAECQSGLGFDKVDTSRTADVWVDTHTRLIHKIRFTDKSNNSNYVDISQDYQGGSAFPFGLDFHNQASVDSNINSGNGSKPDVQTGSLSMKLDTKTNTFSVNGNFADSADSNSKGSLTLTIAPNNSNVPIQKPAGAKTIIQLLDDLGLGSLVSGANSSSSNSPTAGNSQAASRDAERHSDIRAIQSKVEEYWADNGTYPKSLSVVTGLPAAACQAPGGKGTCANPDYTYKAFKDGTTPSTSASANCVSDCASYIIYTPSSGPGAMEAGPAFSVTSLN